MDPASLIQTMPAEMVSDYLTCRQEQKSLVRSLRSERQSGKALASLFVSRLVDSEAGTEKARLKVNCAYSAVLWPVRIDLDGSIELSPIIRSYARKACQEASSWARLSLSLILCLVIDSVAAVQSPNGYGVRVVIDRRKTEHTIDHACRF